jgi:hypothetical protein
VHAATVAIEEVVVETAVVEVDVVDPVAPVAEVLVVVVVVSVEDVVVGPVVVVEVEIDEGEELQADSPAARRRAVSRSRGRIAGPG